jgi:cytosine/adenosine deaminase-related metal-dependent hydrolase
MSPLNSWWFTGARVAQGPHDAKQLDVEIQAGRVHSLRSSLLHDEASLHLNLRGMLILPGLINAHNHLEFAIFPRLGNRTYTNAQEWARDIYHPDQSPIRELLQVPKATRLFWGGLKNLLCGVTTVCHHNQYEPDVFENRFPVRVLKRYGWSHSFDFSQDVKADFKQTPDGDPFFIHLAEGTDEASRNELDQLDRLGLLNGQTVIVHGVALASQDWELVRQRGSGLVWCPSSNLFTLGKTLDLNSLPAGLEVALGNDSPLTAAGDLLDEIRFAYDLIPPYQGGQAPQARGGYLSGGRPAAPDKEHPSQARGGCFSGGRPAAPGQGHPPQADACPPPSKGESVASSSPLVLDPAVQLYPMVTTSAAHLMGLNQGEGTIVEGGIADLVLVRDTGASPAQRLVQLSATDVELVVLGGEIMLASTLLAEQLPTPLLNHMQKLFYDQRACWVAPNIQPHWEATLGSIGNDFRLARKEISLAMR